MKWEFNTIFGEIKRAISGGNKETDNEVAKVTKYFASIEQINTLKSEIEAINAGNKQGDPVLLTDELNMLRQQNAVLTEAVEKVIERQLREILSQQGIFNPIDKYIKLKVGFPPFNFKLEKPPHLLVVSPRDRIESLREITLHQNLSLEVKESIEAEVDRLEVSSLVVELGGFAGTYPSFVTNEASLRYTTDTAAEEWLHQYLTFKPLGFRYLLDLTSISPNYEIATINETLASMVSKEIGSIMYDKYYRQHENDDTQSETTGSGFDFNHEMKEIRREVDKYLDQGEIEKAEEFMEQKRRYLASQGYHIRKLNQAYFAFHGTYADRPDSISPIGLELKKLRSKSDSLKDFLETAAAMSSRQDLLMSVR
ncbi:hypothetical protein ACFLUZ_03480 [Chloroflexota bacterium]